MMILTKMPAREIHVVLDRDGTLIKHIHYLSNPKKVFLLPGVMEGIKKLQFHQISFSLHTNQSGVGRDYFSMNEVIACNSRMFDLLNLELEAFKEICIAPEAPNQEIKYRKPSPNFGLELINKYNYEVNKIFYIGAGTSGRLGVLDASEILRFSVILIELSHIRKKENKLVMSSSSLRTQEMTSHTRHYILILESLMNLTVFSSSTPSPYNFVWRGVASGQMLSLRMPSLGQFWRMCSVV